MNSITLIPFIALKLIFIGFYCIIKTFFLSRSGPGRLQSAIALTEDCSSNFKVNSSHLNDFICAKSASRNACTTGDGGLKQEDF